MIIKLENGYFDFETIDFETYKKIYPLATESDFNEFKGITKPIELKINGLQEINNRKHNKSNKKISKE